MCAVGISFSEIASQVSQTGIQSLIHLQVIHHYIRHHTLRSILLLHDV